MGLNVIQNGIPAAIIVEEEAYEGVKRIANVVSEDIFAVCDSQPEIHESIEKTHNERLIACATLGKSKIVDKLALDGVIDTSVIKGKRECYMITEIELNKLCNDRIGQAILVVGSDKRGTIYGMFEISEACGVTSLVYMGDCKPKKNNNVMLTVTDNNENLFVSKEPSVMYRGFFINDEWPAFGGWCNEQFGGFNATCYEKLFIFLLRMKGNFMWPAMWSSVFSEDGPGTASAELADCLGVIMGTSHHEPLCRAGEEWQHIYKKYGESNAWNFINNKEAISEFWKDGMLRNKNFENLVTIGMRGEADSKLLGEDATMADNIKVVKDAILAQHNILKQYVNEDLEAIPRVLAIYKEVEDYYYGDSTCEGLKDWDELKDVIFLLSDDNWANTRGLPKEDERKHPGGYGMYYHFDYHGGPFSYEWQNTSRLTKTWEQMTQAYEYGVRKEWIVNVGDLKGNEYPLTYFMALAYDYDKWSKPNMVEEYVSEWIDRHFHGELSKAQKNAMMELIQTATCYNSLRKPEAMHYFIYNPVDYNEAERNENELIRAFGINEGLHNSLKDEAKTAFESLFYYQFRGSMDIQLMQIEAGINAYLAENRSVAANIYESRVKERIADMESAIDEYNRMLGGKWNHMLDSGFTGFRNWDDYDWGYPVTAHVTPIRKPKLMAGFKGDRRYHLGAHWQDGARICNNDMILPDIDCAKAYLDSRGDVDFDFEVVCSANEITAIPARGHVCVKDNPRTEIAISCNKNSLKGQIKSDIDIKVEFADGTSTVLKLAAEAAGDNAWYNEACGNDVHEGIYIEHNGIVSIPADGFTRKTKDNTRYQNAEWRVIDFLGRKGSAVKCLPSTVDYSEVECHNVADAYKQSIPGLEYDFLAEKNGEYTLEIDMLSRNPVVLGEDMIIRAALNEEEIVEMNGVGSDYYAGHTCPQWCAGVLDNVRRIRTNVKVKKGFNKLTIFAASPNISFDKIVLFDNDRPIRESYLGPEFSKTVRC